MTHTPGEPYDYSFRQGASSEFETVFLIGMEDNLFRILEVKIKDE